jgi:hypothetical protein
LLANEIPTALSERARCRSAQTPDAQLEALGDDAQFIALCERSEGPGSREDAERKETLSSLIWETAVHAQQLLVRYRHKNLLNRFYLARVGLSPNGECPPWVESGHWIAI